MTDKLREAAQQALDFILANGDHDQLCGVFALDDDGLHMPCTCGLEKTLSALRAALAQQDAQAVVQEPCAVVKWQTGGPVVHIIGDVQAGDLLYRAAPTPPARSVEAQAVRDGIDAAINFLESGDEYEVKRKIMAAALRCSGLIFDLLWRAAPTPPEQRVMLTDEEIEQASVKGDGTHSGFARAVIEAYEQKNGIK